MKRYLLFKGMKYYPGGGWLDFEGSYSTLKEAKAAATPENDDWLYQWAHIVDGRNGLLLLSHDGPMDRESDWEKVN